MRHTRQGELRGEIRKILVLRHGALGDVILETPALEGLRRRFPKAHITLLCDPTSGPLLEGLDFYDSTIVLHESLSSRKRYYWELFKLRWQRYDLVVAMRGSGRYRWQTAFIGGRNRLGHPSSSWYGSLFFTMTGSFVPGKHQVENALHFLSSIGVEPQVETPRLKISIEDQHRAEAAKILQDAGVTEKFIVLHPTHRDRPWYQNWSDDNFAYVADRLYEHGYQLVVTSGPAQIPMVERITTKCQHPVISLAGKTTPRVLAALFERAELYVGYNTGAMHVASTVRTPIVAIFEEPSNYEKWKPWTDSPFRILAPQQPDGEVVYVTDTVRREDVLNAALELLQPDTAFGQRLIVPISVSDQTSSPDSPDPLT